MIGHHKTRGKHPRCPKCYYRMQRLYIRRSVGGKYQFIGAGWWCWRCGHVEMEITPMLK